MVVVRERIVLYTESQQHNLLLSRCAWILLYIDPTREKLITVLRQLLWYRRNRLGNRYIRIWDCDVGGVDTLRRLALDGRQRRISDLQPCRNPEAQAAYAAVYRHRKPKPTRDHDSFVPAR